MCPVDLISVCALYVVLPKETIISNEDLVFFAVVVISFIHLHPVVDRQSLYLHTQREEKRSEREGRKALSLYESQMETGAN